MRKLVLVPLGLVLTCAPLEEETLLRVGQVSLYHGRLNLSPGDHRAFSVDCQAGDSLIGGARVLSGGEVYTFWADEANYQKWTSGDPSADLRDYQEGPKVSLLAEVDSDGRFYVVVGTQSGARLDLRLKRKREE